MSLDALFERHQSTVRDDVYGVPLDLFGRSVPEDFFAILGRLVATNGQIEYLYDRLNHLPEHERAGIRKVEQFFRRFVAGRDERNAAIHSRWAFGAHTDPDVIVGTRYKINKKSSGLVAVLSITDVAGSERGRTHCRIPPTAAPSRPSHRKHRCARVGSNDAQQRIAREYLSAGSPKARQLRSRLDRGDQIG